MEPKDEPAARAIKFSESLEQLSVQTLWALHEEVSASRNPA